MKEFDFREKFFPAPRYEIQYDQFLQFFKEIAEARPSERFFVKGAPWSWIPLLEYLNVDVTYPAEHFPIDKDVRKFLIGNIANQLTWNSISRTTFEVLCGFRPETVDALWKIDNQWSVKSARLRMFVPQKEFVVTTNNSFYRKEVKDYLNTLKLYAPTKKKVVLVPCSADKPPPSKTQEAVLNLLPSDYYMAIVTGTLGLVPQDLWVMMPCYDQGVPNGERVQKIVKDYFLLHRHEKIVVYVDFYSQQVFNALNELKSISEQDVTFVVPVRDYIDYLDLTSQKYLDALKASL